MRRLLPIFLLFISCVVAKAQFSLSGEDPGSVRWMSMDTPGFRIIYPEGADSLAFVYGSWLEKAKKAASWSSGMEIGQYYKGRMNVVLHSYNPVANASVTWAPKRMDMYTVLDPYSPTPIPWEKLLAIHEGRHASQMQAGAGGGNRVFHYLVGEMFAGAVAGLYPGPTLLEGDAVVAETALSGSGRGRQGSFLEYMAPALDCGDWRDYWRWSLGSDKLYTPDHYRAGYMLVSGMRVFYDDPLFTQEYFSRVRRGGLFVLKKTVKAAGGTTVKKSFRNILENYHGIWSSEAAARAPFMPSGQVSERPWRHVAYSGTVIDKDGTIWTKKSGLTVTGSLASLSPSGKESRVRSFASYASDLAYDENGGRIWWSETLPDIRWTLGGSSRIRFADLSNPSKIHDLTKKGRYFNPAPSKDGKRVAAVEYPPMGGSRAVVLNVPEGSVERIVEAPDSLQFTELTWIGDTLFAAGLSDHGIGIYEVASGRVVLEPQRVELSHLKAFRSSLTFVCDRTGVNEMYLLDVSTGNLRQVTSTRYGISAPAFNPAADTLFYSSLAPSDDPGAYRQGRMIYSTPVNDLPMTPVSFRDIHKYPVAEALSSQEKALAGEAWESIQEYSETSFSAPRRRRKLTPTVHSWAPVYFNVDNVETTSLDEYYKSGSPGATALFQNLVGDGYGFAGYGFHQDPDLKGVWRHSGHIKYVYNGLFPRMELSADFGDRAAYDLQRVRQNSLTDQKSSMFTSKTPIAARPYAEGAFRIYVPLNFSSGGVSRGLVPQVKYRLTNDRINDRISIMVVEEKGGEKKSREVSSVYQDHVSFLSSVDFSLRGYVIRPKAPSQFFPRLGIGAEVGFRSHPGHTLYYSNTAFLYTYGYLPGPLQDQGIKLTATLGAKVGGGEYSFPEMGVSFVPRGFEDSNVRSIMNASSTGRIKLTFDYNIRLLSLDWSGLGPLAYVKSLSMTPFADLTSLKFATKDAFLVNPGTARTGNLTSVGVDLVVTLGNFLWLPYDSRIGIRYARNSWNNLEHLNAKGLTKDHFGAIFSVSL